jgi:hypothetical protein
MVDVGEAIGVYTLFGALFLLLVVGVVGRAMGMTDASAPSTLCCVDSGDGIDDEEAQRNLRVSFERQSKHKREAEEYETKHKQAMLAKKGSASKPPPRPKAATVESPNGKVLKKAAAPAGSSEGARPSSLKFAEGPHPSPVKGGSRPSTKQPSASSVAGRQPGTARSNPRSSRNESDSSSTSTQRALPARPKATKGPLANKGATF